MELIKLIHDNQSSIMTVQTLTQVVGNPSEGLGYQMGMRITNKSQRPLDSLAFELTMFSLEICSLAFSYAQWTQWP